MKWRKLNGMEHALVLLIGWERNVESYNKCIFHLHLKFSSQTEIKKQLLIPNLIVKWWCQKQAKWSKTGKKKLRNHLNHVPNMRQRPYICRVGHSLSLDVWTMVELIWRQKCHKLVQSTKITIRGEASAFIHCHTKK